MLPLLLSPEQAREYLGITQTAWREWVRRGIVETVPYTDRYDRRELEGATERARKHKENDNTIRLQGLQSPKESKPKPAKSNGYAAGWTKERASRALAHGATEESR